MLKVFRAVCRRVGADRSGNVAVFFAISLIPMIGLVGMGIDVGRAYTTKASLDAAADAAALAAATEAEATLTSPTGVGSLGVANAQYAGTVAGQKIFAADALKAAAWLGSAPTPQVTVTINSSAQTVVAQATYATTVPTVFGRFLKTSTMPIAGLATSTLKLPSYLNISVAVDISQSMGLAATDADMTKLQGLTGGCAFGCHVYQPGQTGTLPYETLAHNNSVQLRIDVIRTATQNMIATAKAQQGSSGLISFALYTLQGSPGTPFSVLSAPSTDYTALTTAANGIDLGPNTSAGIGDTDYNKSLPTLSSTVATSGTGATSTSPQQFVFLMTDGVMDIPTFSTSCSNWWGGHCSAPFDSSLCASLKAKGVTVGVIYTTYLAMPVRPEYQGLVASFASQIAPNLQSCASPGWFYQANDGTDIQTAINALFAKATGRGVLTQ